ncbi:PREDICTED: uncharacterized protein LOC106128574 isoform X2 [Papilio xuthus]|uniref:Uncharacterized protein LOC106128574 isoform X2 n=1 Tax=Papilio xuthus TaxID=66420 RepID=A0AAJ7ELP9_PAPXU|nr:PREDICTED: uncharacterized protein LOC106128574 isoform X2 [Papilio xuthus]
MDPNVEKSVNWGDMETTADPNVSISTISEDVPTLTLATILGVTVVIIIAIAVVFVLGVLIDCRQQILDKKIGEVRRRKNLRRAKSHPQADVVSIVNEMEGPGLSVPPVEALRTIP